MTPLAYGLWLSVRIMVMMSAGMAYWSGLETPEKDKEPLK